MVLFESLFYGIWALNLVLVACEVGQRVSNTFSDVDDTFEQIDWYLLPMEIQRMLQLAIMYTQEPILLKFFGSSSCTREQFQKVRTNTNMNHMN